MNESVQNSRIAIVSLHQATLACRWQSHALPQVQHGSSGRNQKFNFMGSCALPYYDKQTGRVEHGISCAGCQLAIEKDIIGTRGTKWGYEARDKVYAQDGFLDHFRWCEQAQLLWRSSGEGKNQPPELPVSARTGGYFEEEKSILDILRLAHFDLIGKTNRSGLGMGIFVFLRYSVAD